MILEGWDATQQVHRFQKAISSIWRSRLDENAPESHRLAAEQSGIDVEEWLLSQQSKRFLQKEVRKSRKVGFLPFIVSR